MISAASAGAAIAAEDDGLDARDVAAASAGEEEGGGVSAFGRLRGNISISVLGIAAGGGCDGATGAGSHPRGTHPAPARRPELISTRRYGGTVGAILPLRPGEAHPPRFPVRLAKPCSQLRFRGTRKRRRADRGEPPRDGETEDRASRVLTRAGRNTGEHGRVGPSSRDVAGRRGWRTRRGGFGLSPSSRPSANNDDAVSSVAPDGTIDPMVAEAEQSALTLLRRELAASRRATERERLVAKRACEQLAAERAASAEREEEPMTLEARLEALTEGRESAREGVPPRSLALVVAAGRRRRRRCEARDVPAGRRRALSNRRTRPPTRRRRRRRMGRHLS